MHRSYPVIPVPPEHEAQRPSFNRGLSEGRHQDVRYPREWFLSDAAYAAYLAGFEVGKRQRNENDQREGLDASD